MADKPQQKFNKLEYDRQYHRTHYKNISVVFSLEDGERLERAAQRMGITKSSFIKNAVLKQLNEDQTE